MASRQSANSDCDEGTLPNTCPEVAEHLLRDPSFGQHRRFLADSGNSSAKVGGVWPKLATTRSKMVHGGLRLARHGGFKPKLDQRWSCLGIASPTWPTPATIHGCSANCGPNQRTSTIKAPSPELARQTLRCPGESDQDDSLQNAMDQVVRMQAQSACMFGTGLTWLSPFSGSLCRRTVRRTRKRRHPSAGCGQTWGVLEQLRVALHQWVSASRCLGSLGVHICVGRQLQGGRWLRRGGVDLALGHAQPQERRAV